MSKIVFVLAMSDNGVIGDRGAIPWRIPEDMRHFKVVTMGKPFIVGRKTWESFPKRPLPGRTNIVVTRHATFRAEGAKVAHSVEEALALAEAEHPDAICVAGGAEIYNILRDRAETVHLTEVHADFAGDAKLEKFAPPEWCEISREDYSTPDGLRYSFVTLERA